MRFEQLPTLIDHPAQNPVGAFGNRHFRLGVGEHGAVQVGEGDVHMRGANVHAEHRVARSVEGELARRPAAG